MIANCFYNFDLAWLICRPGVQCRLFQFDLHGNVIVVGGVAGTVEVERERGVQKKASNNNNRNTDNLALAMYFVLNF